MFHLFFLFNLPQICDLLQPADQFPLQHGKNDNYFVKHTRTQTRGDKGRDKKTHNCPGQDKLRRQGI